ncbi:hypothetical protein SAMN05216251_1404 [Actinacidiphila alni]|uniref:GIY-YIG nuclease family protein n=1 Tax=Actinacidiphila alni TaxID=380248 RepID=A0A1I2MNA8_9ACTN|nr:hypothetical protein [Actinacidiphila alni]SFF93055.1 hypothetical protein SAMN05216251_1404 [Actinacidiphila alni]
MNTPSWAGVVTMTPARYRYLADLAGGNLLASWPVPHSLRAPYDGDEEKAVYIVANREGLACYVGQTRPARAWTGAAGIRLSQHMAEPSKRDEWDSFWVLPLKWSTKPTIVDWYEATVAARLMVPLRHRRRRSRI